MVGRSRGGREVGEAEMDVDDVGRRRIKGVDGGGSTCFAVIEGICVGSVRVKRNIPFLAMSSYISWCGKDICFKNRKGEGSRRG